MYKLLELIVVVLLIIGGLNWGLVGLFGVDLVATLLGAGTGAARLVYILVGLAAVFRIVSWKCSSCKICK